MLDAQRAVLGMACGLLAACGGRALEQDTSALALRAGPPAISPGQVVAFAPAQGEVSAIASDGLNLYYVTYGIEPVGGQKTNAVMKLSLSEGSRPQPLMTGFAGYAQTQRIAVDEANMYTTASSQLVRIPIHGETPTALSPSGSPSVVLSNGAVYWPRADLPTHGFTLGRLPTASSAPGTLGDVVGSIACDNGGGCRDMAADLSNVYCSCAGTATTPDETLVAFPIDGSGAHPIEGSGANSIVADETAIYATSVWQGSVLKYPKDRSPPVTLATGQQGMVQIVADDTNVYWSTGAQSGDAWTGSIMKVAKSGGTVVVLATMTTPLSPGVIAPGAIAVDQKNAYWADSTGVIQGTAK